MPRVAKCSGLSPSSRSARGETGSMRRVHPFRAPRAAPGAAPGGAATAAATPWRLLRYRMAECRAAAGGGGACAAAGCCAGVCAHRCKRVAPRAAPTDRARARAVGCSHRWPPASKVDCASAVWGPSLVHALDVGRSPARAVQSELDWPERSCREKEESRTCEGFGARRTPVWPRTAAKSGAARRCLLVRRSAAVQRYPPARMQRAA